MVARCARRSRRGREKASGKLVPNILLPINVPNDIKLSRYVLLQQGITQHLARAIQHVVLLWTAF
jgi:hypothetical protein